MGDEDSLGMCLVGGTRIPRDEPVWRNEDKLKFFTKKNQTGVKN